MPSAIRDHAHIPLRVARGVRTSASGFTLVELLVVIAIMGIGMALVTATWWQRDGATGREDESSAQAVIARARRLAVARGERLVLQMHDDGAWLVRGTQATPSIDTVAAGRLASVRPPNAATFDGPPAFRIDIDPLGSCRTQPGVAHAIMFDVTHCRWVAASPVGAP